MKPNITVYSRGGPEETKKLDGFISASFWIGVDHAEGDLESVKIRLPTESYDFDVATLIEFTTLLVQRQINFSIEFFTEPSQPHAPVNSEIGQDIEAGAESSPPIEEAELPEGTAVDYESELVKIKEQFKKGQVTKKQFESKKGELLKKWKEGIEEKLEG